MDHEKFNDLICNAEVSVHYENMTVDDKMAPLLDVLC